jgi:hypothetical protein
MPPRSRSSPPPPRPPSRPPPKKHAARRREPALDAGAIDAALASSIPDARDRAFVLRCIVDEGPRHHRIASWALLRMLAAVLAELGGADAEPRGVDVAPLPIRLPPSVTSSSEDAVFPIGVPMRMLRDVLDENELATALDALRDGPAHHALANAVMVALIDAIHARVRRAGDG